MCVYIPYVYLKGVIRERVSERPCPAVVGGYGEWLGEIVQWWRFLFQYFNISFVCLFVFFPSAWKQGVKSSWMLEIWSSGFTAGGKAKDTEQIRTF